MEGQRHTPFHKAKDVAAFANYHGGTLLIGAHESNNQLRAYVGMPPSDATKVCDAYSKAIEQRCQPQPRLDFESYADPKDSTKRIIAVNVWPSLLLVGERVEAHKASEGYGGVSFVYPVRAGTDATYLEPGQLAMYMTPQVRRVAVLLSPIPRGTSIVIKRPEGDDFHEYTARLEEVREAENVVTLSTPDDVMTRLPNLPLDRITTVFQDWDIRTSRLVWRIYLQLRNR